MLQIEAEEAAYAQARADARDLQLEIIRLLARVDDLESRCEKAERALECAMSDARASKANVARAVARVLAARARERALRTRSDLLEARLHQVTNMHMLEVCRVEAQPTRLSHRTGPSSLGVHVAHSRVREPKCLKSEERGSSCDGERSNASGVCTRGVLY